MMPTTSQLSAPTLLDDGLRFVRVDMQSPRAGQTSSDDSAADSVTALDPHVLHRHAPDAHWELHQHGVRIGRYSAWWSRTPLFRGQRVGFIGHLAANGSQIDAILQHACGQLSAHACTLAVGPVDGSTWCNYRLVTEPGRRPPFFLEPQNPIDWPALFSKSGFAPLAHYFSAECRDLGRRDGRVERARARLEAAGVHLRPLRTEALEADFLKIHSLARVAFRDNPLYSEPTVDEFLADCRALAALVSHDFVLLAEHHQRPVGFILALPDLLQKQRGEPVDTLIVKTLAALPERGLAGLGQWLLSDVQQRAHAAGYRRAIHALVRDVGHLRRISTRWATPIRRYTLFARALQP